MFSFTTLKTVEGLGQLPEWAAFHHEKPDGSGYPFRINAEKLSMGSRIMAIADIFTALAEDRPYRSGMSRNDIKKTMSGMFNNQTMDKRIINLLFENYEEISAPAKEKQAIVYQDYENLGLNPR
ncbi:MAG: HD domain-containing phosphohydrolase [Gallionella sp.]|nr:HD domain-containing phosphohydrolase [Gallionella sp.]